MKTLVITGGIGSGKSAAAACLSSLGFPVYDCDSRTKLLYSLVPGLKCRIEDALDLPWSQIGTVFSDPAKLAELESIVYPYVLEDLRSWKAAQTAPLLFVESAIALDKPQFDGMYDRVLLITAPYEVRAARNPKAAERDALQRFDAGRIDFTVVNDTTPEDMFIQIRKLICKLI
jgi:dephospho-CoA kinase